MQKFIKKLLIFQVLLKTHYLDYENPHDHSSLIIKSVSLIIVFEIIL